ncbi:MAG: hypothetical protein AAFX99_05695 [Myxococcota bacterium]
MQTRPQTHPLVALGAALLVAASACGGPPDPTAGLKDATDTKNAKACKEGGPALPYTVGMNQTMIGQIITAMGSGKLVAVRYTCDEFYMVPGCELEEPALQRMQGYRFIQTPLLSESKTFKGQAEISGNFSSVSVSGSGAASASLEATLETRLIGSRLTNISRVDETQLDQFGCREATHFIKKAQVGAFRLNQESQSSIAATIQASTPVASGGGSVNTEQARRLGLEGGKWASCEEEDNAQCQVPVQLTLLPILSEPLEGDTPIAIAPPPMSPANACPPGQVYSGGRCVSKARAAELGGFACDPKNEAQCVEQCSDGKGNADSCNSLGELLLGRDQAKARTHFEYACSARKDPSMQGCANLGDALLREGQADKAKSNFEKACTAGVGQGCYGLGLVLERNPEMGSAASEESTGEEDPDESEEMDLMALLPPQLEKFQMACDAGYAPGCSRVGGFAMVVLGSVIDLGTGDEYNEDEIMARMGAAGIDENQMGIFFEFYFNSESAALYMERCIDERESQGRDPTGCFLDKMVGDIEAGCMGGSSRGCYRLGKLYETGVFATDLKSSVFRARALFKAACKDGEVKACAEEAAYYAREELLLEEPADPKRAFSLVWKACTGETLKGMAKLKRPGAQDNGLAILDPDGCAELAWLLGGERVVDVSRFTEGDQDKREEFAREMLKLVCHKYKSPRGCYLLGQAYERPALGFGRDEAEAVSGYTRACQQGRSDACYRLGKKFRDGRGVIRDLDRAIVLYLRGCELDANPRACYDLAELALRQCDIGQRNIGCFFYQRFSEEIEATQRANNASYEGNTGADGQTLTMPQRFSSAIFDAYMTACQESGYTRACLRGAEQLISFAQRKQILNLPPSYGVMTDALLDRACRRSSYDGRIPEYSVNDQRYDARRACMVAGERFSPPGARGGVNAEAFYRYLVACNDFDYAEACTRVASFYQDKRRDNINAERYMRRTCELETDQRFRQLRRSDVTHSPRSSGGGLFGGGNQSEVEERQRKYKQERALIRSGLSSCQRANEMARAARRDQCLKAGLTTSDRFQVCMEAAQMLGNSRDVRAARTVRAIYKQACDAERTLEEGGQIRSGACVKLEIEQCNRAQGAKKVGELLAEIDADCTDNGLSEACAYAGEVYYRSGPPGRPGLVERNMSRARDRLRRACSRGSGAAEAKACTLLGDLHLEDKGKGNSERLYRDALTQYVRGCDKGHGLACHKIGMLFNVGVKEVFVRDVRRARTRFQQACRLGHAPACGMMTGNANASNTVTADAN